MKIKYKKKRLNHNLIFAIIWTVLGFLSLNYSGDNNWMDYGYLFIAILYWFSYFYDKTNHYLTIEDEWIKIHSPFGKKIKLAEIIWIKKFAGDYILMTDKDKLTINTQIIEPNSLTELNRILEQLNLPSHKTPFAGQV